MKVEAVSLLQQAGLNWADGVVVLVLVAGFFIGKKKGAMAMILGAVYAAISITAALVFYPLVSGIIRTTPLFERVKAGIGSGLGLEQAAQVYTKQQETGLITALNLPDGLKTRLLENNNSVIYQLIGADSLVDYITGFLANILINFVLVWLLFALFMVCLKLIFRFINSLAQLPVISGFNRLIGAWLGVAFSCLVVWLGYLGVYAFITKPWALWVYGAVNSSPIAGWFYNHNPLLEFLLHRMF